MFPAEFRNGFKPDGLGWIIFMRYHQSNFNSSRQQGFYTAHAYAMVGKDDCLAVVAETGIIRIEGHLSCVHLVAFSLVGAGMF